MHFLKASSIIDITFKLCFPNDVIFYIKILNNSKNKYKKLYPMRTNPKIHESFHEVKISHDQIASQLY